MATSTGTQHSVNQDLSELPPTISIPQAAELLGIGRNQAYQAAARGELPTVRLGGRILVLTAPLRRMLRADEQPASAPARGVA